ncbi:zinc finger-like domain-containing protein [Meiothermus sp. Pnk-1]|uniref:zinc finger-like domain-containing protein n=1 Tax=Meiothermus sp. Pnk-1 TaxID=873128 RepID=UPI000D7D1662|nr:zinc finger-like domain-containing protein [Meiothermus sp. Pnk-1]PZA08316.1 hypothetical protein DNA98_04045 [Meiothermus sp. Pnk-1]
MSQKSIHQTRALAAWRRAHPEGLVGRLLDLHLHDPAKARTLAYYADKYALQFGQGYGLLEDVAAWPKEGSMSALEDTLRQMLAPGVSLEIRRYPALYLVKIVSNGVAHHSYEGDTRIAALIHAAYGELEQYLRFALFNAINNQPVRLLADREHLVRLVNLLENLEVMGRGLAASMVFAKKLEPLLRTYLERCGDKLEVRRREGAWWVSSKDQGKTFSAALARMAIRLLYSKQQDPCPVCGGLGRIDDIPCWKCDGEDWLI